jgi:hypothetical protein
MRLTMNQSILLSSAGYGVLASLALNGAARIIGGLVGSPLSTDNAGLLFLASCAVLVPITTYFRVAQRFFPPATSQSDA